MNNDKNINDLINGATVQDQFASFMAEKGYALRYDSSLDACYHIDYQWHLPLGITISFDVKTNKWNNGDLYCFELPVHEKLRSTYNTIARYPNPLMWDAWTEPTTLINPVFQTVMPDYLAIPFDGKWKLLKRNENQLVNRLMRLVCDKFNGYMPEYEKDKPYQLACNHNNRKGCWLTGVRYDDIKDYFIDFETIEEKLKIKGLI